jgi:hypothetical protein
MSNSSPNRSLLHEIQKLREEREQHLQQVKVLTSCIYELQQRQNNGNQNND